MREVTKSFFRLSWAMTVFGIDQLSRLTRRDDEDDEEQSEHRVASALDSVSEGTEKHLDKRAKSLYESGDKLQSELVDLMFDSVKPEEWKPKRILERAAELADKSADALRDLATEDESEDEESESAPN